MSNSLKDVQVKVGSVVQELIKTNLMILKLIENCENKKFNEIKSIFKNGEINNQILDIDVIIEEILLSNIYKDEELKSLILYLKTSNELSRILNNTRLFFKKIESVCKDIDKKGIKKLTIKMHEISIKSLECLADMINSDNKDDTKELFDEIILLESKTDDVYDLIQKELIKNAKESNKCDVHNEILTVLRKSEKISSRVLTIAYLLNR